MCPENKTQRRISYVVALKSVKSEQRDDVALWEM